MSNDAMSGDPTAALSDETVKGFGTWFYVQHLAKRLLTAQPPLETADDLTRLIESAEQLRARAVDDARHDGESWAKIGAAMGMSKQAAQQRYGQKPTTDVDDEPLPLD